MVFDRFRSKANFAFLRTATPINGRPAYRSIDTVRGQPILTAFWSPPAQKWLFAKAPRGNDFSAALEDTALFAIDQDVQTLDQVTTILLKRSLLGKLKKGEPLPELKQHLLYNFRFFGKSFFDSRESRSFFFLLSLSCPSICYLI